MTSTKFNINDDKPTLLKATEILLANPTDIKKEVDKLFVKYYKKYSSEKTEEQVKEKIAKKIVSNYSTIASFVGGATGLTGVIPGLGTVISVFGGAMADIALTMKYEIEMVMALAYVYEHDIEIEEEKRLCFIIAGLGAMSKAFKEGGEKVGTKAFIRIVQQHLKGSTLQAIKQIFKKVGIKFTRKGLEKAAPFGVSVIIGVTANKSLTYFVGTRAMAYFETN